MNRVRLGFRGVDIVDGLRAGALVLLILMAIAFFADYANREEVGSVGVLRKQESGHEFNGKMGASSDRSG